MRLLVADKLHPRAVEELRTLPVDVLYEPEVTKETIEQKIPGIGILVVRSKEVTKKALESAKQLNLIVRAGSETSTIDVKTASERGIYVANCPGKNATAVAELVLGMCIALDRRIGQLPHPDALGAVAPVAQVEQGAAHGEADDDGRGQRQHQPEPGRGALGDDRVAIGEAGGTHGGEVHGADGEGEQDRRPDATAQR